MGTVFHRKQITNGHSDSNLQYFGSRFQTKFHALSGSHGHNKC